MKAVLGAALGAVAGFVVGGPLGAIAGATIGAGIGTLMTPIKVQGAKVGEEDFPAQNSGTPIGFVLGRGPIKGDLLWQGPRRIVETETEQDAKGGSTKVTEEQVQRDFAIDICESNVYRGTVIKRMLMVREANKIVYDVRPESQLTAADNAKFMENTIFYFGGVDQGVDPTYAAIFGADNVTAYRGKCHMVRKEVLLGKFGNAIPTYDFVVENCDVAGATGGDVALAQILITGTSDTPFIVAEATEVPTFVVVDPLTGADLGGASGAVNQEGVWIAVGQTSLRYATNVLGPWSTVATPFALHGGRFNIYGPDGWLLQYIASGHAGELASASSIPTDIAPASVDLAGSVRSSFSWINLVDNKYYGCVGFQPDLLWSSPTIDGVWVLVTTEGGSITTGTDSIRFSYDMVRFEGALYWACYTSSAFGSLGGGDCLRRSVDEGATFDEILVDGRDSATTMPFQMEKSETVLIVVNRDATQVWTSADDFAEPHATGVSRNIEDLPRNEKEGRFIAKASGRFYIMGDAGVVSTADGITFSAVATYPATFSGARSITAKDTVDVGPYTAVSGRVIPDLSEPYHELDNVAGGLRGYNQLEEVSGVFRVLDETRLYIGPTVVQGDPLYLDEDYWTELYDDATALGYFDGTGVYGVDYPDTVNTAYRVTVGVDSAGSTCSLTLAQVVQALGKRTPLPIPDDVLITTQLEGISVLGMAVREQGPVSKVLDGLMELYQFDLPQIDGLLQGVLRGGEVDVVIDSADVIRKADIGDVVWKRSQRSEYEKVATLKYVDPAQDYNESSQRSVVRTPDHRAKGEKTYTTSVVLAADEAATRLARIHAVRQDEIDGTLTLELPMKYLALVPSSVISYMGRRGCVRKMRHEPWKIILEEVMYDRASSFQLSVTGSSSGSTGSAGGGSLAGITDAVFFNSPVINDNYDMPGIHVAVSGKAPAWAGARIDISRQAGVYVEGVIPNITTRAIIGELIDSLPAGNPFVTDETSKLRVRILTPNAELTSIDMLTLLNEGNACVIQMPDGRVECLQFRDVEEFAPSEWEASYLLRCRLDTPSTAHAAGAKFVMLNDAVRFIQLRKDDVGKTITPRAVSLGTLAANNEASPPITLTTMESQREWAPYNVVVTKLLGCEWQVDFIGRPRLGTDANPIQSEWFVGWRIDFTIGSVTKSRMTTEESFIYTTAMQEEDWGAVQCAGYAVTVVAVNSYTGSDGGGGTGGGTTPVGNPDYPATIIGGPSDGYVGEPIYDWLGPQWGAPFQAYGGLTEERFIGDIVGNVTCQSGSPGSGFVVGIPLVAETRNAATEMIATGPAVGGGGPFLITDSVTIAAKPTYSMMDELKPYAYGRLVTLVTTPARTTKRVTSSGIGGLKSRAGTNTDKVRCVFTVTDLAAGGSISIGVVAAGVDDHLVPGTAGSYGYLVTTNGVYVVELDGATGDVEVFEIGVGSVATATLTNSHAYDGLYRFAWRTTSFSPGVTVHTNMGNEAWPDTPTAGFGGLPNAPSIVPCGFDATVGTANNYWLQGMASLTEATRGGISGEKLVYAYSTFGKSTGKWRFGAAILSTSRAGLCKAGHTGYLGGAGTADSIGFTDTRTTEGFIIETSFSGVHNRIEIPPFFYYANRAVLFAFDADAGTLGIYVKIEVVAGDPTATYELLTTLTGIPAGTWLPAFNGGGQLMPEVSEPATYNDWTVTL